MIFPGVLSYETYPFQETENTTKSFLPDRKICDLKEEWRLDRWRWCNTPNGEEEEEKPKNSKDPLNLTKKSRTHETYHIR